MPIQWMKYFITWHEKQNEATIKMKFISRISTSTKPPVEEKTLASSSLEKGLGMRFLKNIISLILPVTVLILGVLTVLLGEATMFSSVPILTWAGTFFMINTIYFFILEEPQLDDRFGEDYRLYKKHVSCWIPRMKPYQPQEK